MSRSRVVVLTLLAMLAFAGNSLLCRLALKHTAIDAASFTTVRLVSASLVLCVLAGGWRTSWQGGGNWPSALALFVYAAGFSFAYINLTAATGALLLFGAVQATMIGYGVWAGERLLPLQFAGLALAMGGLVALVLPGLATPPLGSAVLMLAAGVAWGVYSLRGKRGQGASSPITVTAGNFLRTVPFTLCLSLLMGNAVSLDAASNWVGFWYAFLSGALTSGVGYVIWYKILPTLKATPAATVQLSVPVIAAVGGVVLLGEPLSLRLVLSSVAILAGIWLVIPKKKLLAARPANALAEDARL
jgi:drug/metabolite transporter (DMT)-like permease